MNFKRHLLIFVLGVGGIIFSWVIVWVIQGSSAMNGVMKTARTNAVLRRVAEEIPKQTIQPGRPILPQISSRCATLFTGDDYPAFQNGRLYDAWNHPLRVEWSTLEKGKIELRSAGSDGEMDTEDDLVLTVLPASTGVRK